MTEENRKRVKRGAAVLIWVLLLSIGLWKGLSPSARTDEADAANAATTPPAQEQFELAAGVQPPAVLTGNSASTPSGSVDADWTADLGKADAGHITQQGASTGTAGAPAGSHTSASLYPTPVNDVYRPETPNGAALGNAIGANPTGASAVSGNSFLAGVGSSHANGAAPGGSGSNAGPQGGGAGGNGGDEQAVPFGRPGQPPDGTPHPDVQTSDNSNSGSGMPPTGGDSHPGAPGTDVPGSNPGTPFTDSGVDPNKGSDLLTLDQPSDDGPPNSDGTPINNPSGTQPTNPLASVPEPSELLLLSTAVLLTLRRLKRLRSGHQRG